MVKDHSDSEKGNPLPWLFTNQCSMTGISKAMMPTAMLYMLLTGNMLQVFSKTADFKLWYAYP